MREIAFRGMNFFTKELVYGQTIRQTDDGFDFWNGDDWIHCTNCDQLIAIDKNNREVYENDKVIRIADVDDEDFDIEKSFPMYATFDDYTAINSGEIVLVVENKSC